MFEFDITETTTFWSHDEMVRLIRENNDRHKNLQDLNEAPWRRYVGKTMQLLYEGLPVGSFTFGGCDFQQDTPIWTYGFDSTTNKYKFRLDIENVLNGGHGAQAPLDLRIRPAGYDKSWKLSWRYKRDTGVKVLIPGIEIFVVDGDNRFENVVYTLWYTDFGEHGVKWLRNREPIVIRKHETYITIRCSAHMARGLGVEKSYHERTAASFVEDVMSDDEAAWIFADGYFEKQVLDEKDRTTGPAPARAPRPYRLSVMLAALQELAGAGYATGKSSTNDT